MKISQSTRTRKGASFLLLGASLLGAVAQAAPQQAKTFRNVRGQVISVSAAKKGEPASAIVDHEDIPNFMRAMRMSMPLKNKADAKKLRAGDKIRFDMTLQKGSFVVANVRKLAASTQLKLAKGPGH